VVKNDEKTDQKVHLRLSGPTRMDMGNRHYSRLFFFNAQIHRQEGGYLMKYLIALLIFSAAIQILGKVYHP